jgi:SAM-dependent methyltransferase
MSKPVLVPCPICRSEEDFYIANNTDQDLHIRKYGELYAGIEKSQWRVCGNCGFVHQNPRPSVADLNRFYLNSQYHPPEIPEAWQAAENYLEFARWYYDEKIDYALKESGLQQGAVFDIGFGAGGVLKLFADRGWQAYGVESDHMLIDYAKNKLGLGLTKEGILDNRIEISARVDLVFSNHTFEHIADLHDAMIGLRKILKPGGYVFTAVPTYYRNRSRLSLEWMNSSHYSLLTHNSLNQLFSHYGLEEVTHTYRGWRKEIDDLWHVAKFTGTVAEPSTFYEDPRHVRRYVNKINPLRSLICYPVYSDYARRVQIYEAIKRRVTRQPEAHYPRMLWYYTGMLLTSPGQLIRKAAHRLRKKFI